MWLKIIAFLSVLFAGYLGASVFSEINWPNADVVLSIAVLAAIVTRIEHD